MAKKLTLGISMGILTVLYLVGVLGIGFEILPGMAALTSLHLLISFLFLVYWHKGKTVNFWIWLILAYTIGFGVEYLGVKYGFLFGSYSYGANLEPTLMGTPLIIGINWILLSYCFTHLIADLSPRRLSIFFVAAISATLMTAFDLIIEPVAIELDFWNWAGESVPWTNYTGWWLVSFLINFLYLKFGVSKGRNPISIWILVLQLFFFVSVYVLRVI